MKKKTNRLSNSLLISAKVKNETDFGISTFESDVHVNLWKKSNKSYDLDLGVMLYGINPTEKKELDSICFFLPFNCDRRNIKDLGKRLRSNEEISTIFNESYKMESGPDKSSMTKFSLQETSGFEFYLFVLGEKNITTKFEESLNGTFLTISIPIPNVLKTVVFNLYIRFRISISDNEGIRFLKHDEQISNNILQAAFSRMELYDFRLNDIRDTDDKVYQELISNQKYKLLEMRKVHFFFMTDAKDHISNGNEERIDTRMLEVEKWKKYHDVSSDHALVAYHWKKKTNQTDKKIKSFEAFFRNTCNNVNVLLVISYIVLILAFGTTGSLLSTINVNQCFNFQPIVANVITYFLFVILYYIGKCR